MVKLEEDFDDDFEEFEDFKEEKPEIPCNYDYKSRRILVWVVEEEIQSMVEETLGSLLSLATIRVVNSEKKTLELSEREEWDTYVVDLTEEGVSDSEFVKMANNNPDVMLIALNYPYLNREDEQFAMYCEPTRKLFDKDFISNQPEEPPLDKDND